MTPESAIELAESTHRSAVIIHGNIYVVPYSECESMERFRIPYTLLERGPPGTVLYTPVLRKPDKRRSELPAILFGLCVVALCLVFVEVFLGLALLVFCSSVLAVACKSATKLKRF